MRIEIKNVSKNYSSNKAVDQLNVTLAENKIYGLLGRNGAGKTTLMQLLAGHTLPSSGEILVDGKAPFDNREVLKNICLVNESNNFIRRLKIKDILKIASLFYPNWSQETAEELIQVFNLKPSLNTKGLSKGMESALGIIIGLSSRAKITIFDEPYIGLDASARYKFYDILLEEYEKYPRTIILSTHLIDEVSNLFEEVILLNKGQLLFYHTADELTQMSIVVSGTTELVETYTKGKNVVHETSLVGTKTAVLFGESYSLDEAKAIGLKVEPCNIQQLMVYLTEEERGGRLYV